MNWFRSKFTKVRCKDGSERMVCKNPDDAFPLYLKDSTTKVKTEADLLKELQVKMDVDTRKLVSGLLFHIDEVNSSLAIQFRCAYLTFIGHPCGLDKWLAKQVALIIKEETKMRNSINRFRLKIIQGSATKDALSEMISEMDSNKKDDVSGEIKKSLADSGKWREGAS